MDEKTFMFHHINASTEDLEGNDGIGRYILLPGSDGRAKEISSFFEDLTIKTHPRGHHLYLGNLSSNSKKIAVATIASGMGCPSMEIILHELFHLGGKRFIRVGTAGSLQPQMVKVGDIINVQASVRDEQTTLDYVPIGIPAVAAHEIISAVEIAKRELNLAARVHIGTVHCKSSLYAREFCSGPCAEKNQHYLNLLTHCGILGSEMETSALFIQSQLYDYQLSQLGKGPEHRVLSGAILGVISAQPDKIASAAEETTILNNLIALGLETIKVLFEQDNKGFPE